MPGDQKHADESGMPEIRVYTKSGEGLLNAKMRRNVTLGGGILFKDEADNIQCKAAVLVRGPIAADQQMVILAGRNGSAAEKNGIDDSYTATMTGEGGNVVIDEVEEGVVVDWSLSFEVTDKREADASVEALKSAIKDRFSDERGPSKVERIRDVLDEWYREGKLGHVVAEISSMPGGGIQNWHKKLSVVCELWQFVREKYQKDPTGQIFMLAIDLEWLRAKIEGEKVGE